MKILYILIFILFSSSSFAETNQKSTKLSDNQIFKVSYTSKVEPIEINRLHAWLILIQDKNGKRIENAEILVQGGMPEHNHGFPTQPKITKYLGDGCYLLEGMKFHMMGYWTINLSITDGEISDDVTFELNL